MNLRKDHYRFRSIYLIEINHLGSAEGKTSKAELCERRLSAVFVPRCVLCSLAVQAIERGRRPGRWVRCSVDRRSKTPQEEITNRSMIFALSRVTRSSPSLGSLTVCLLIVASMWAETYQVEKTTLCSGSLGSGVDEERS